MNSISWNSERTRSNNALEDIERSTVDRQLKGRRWFRRLNR